MSTGFAGMKVRKKTFEKVYTGGAANVLYQPPSDVLFTLLYIQWAKVINFDFLDNFSVIAQRDLSGSWKDLGTILTGAGSIGASNANAEAMVVQKFDANGVLNSSTLVTSGSTDIGFGKSDDIALTYGDRMIIKADSLGAGESVEIKGFFVEHYTGSATIL